MLLSYYTVLLLDSTRAIFSSEAILKILCLPVLPLVTHEMWLSRLLFKINSYFVLHRNEISLAANWDKRLKFNEDSPDLLEHLLYKKDMLSVNLFL